MVIPSRDDCVFSSPQNVSFVNTVLATATASAFKSFADAIEAGGDPRAVVSSALADSWKAIFNGNGYDRVEQARLTEKGIWRIDSGVEAIKTMTSSKNLEIFSSLKVYELHCCEFALCFNVALLRWMLSSRRRC